MTDGPILVTGAGGFVCSEVCVALARAGHAVVAVDRHFDAATRARLGSVRRIEGDVAEVLAALGDLGPAAVIHGAAVTAPPEALGLSRAAHLRRNLGAHLAALEAARAAGAARFLFLSSMGVFAPGDVPLRDGCMTEAARPTADCAYCVAKRVGETLTEAAAEPGFATLSLRLGNVFGPHEAARETRVVLSLAARMLDEAREGGLIRVATPDALRDWAWLPDLAAGIAGLAAGFPPGTPPVLHAGRPPVLTDRALARAIAERVPGTILRVAPAPHAALRPPMGTDSPGPMAALRWTPILEALDRLCAPEPVA